MLNTVQKLFNHATDAFKTASTSEIQKKGERDIDLVGNKTVGKIPKTTTGKLITPAQKENTVKRLLEITKERFISPQKTTNY